MDKHSIVQQPDRLEATAQRSSSLRKAAAPLLKVLRPPRVRIQQGDSPRVSRSDPPHSPETPSCSTRHAPGGQADSAPRRLRSGAALSYTQFKNVKIVILLKVTVDLFPCILSTLFFNSQSVLSC